MGFLSRAIVESKGMNTLDLLREIYGGRTTATGRSVNISTAIEVSAVFACNRVIGNGMAQVPLKLMRETPDGKTKLPAKDHPLYKVMSVRTNRWQTSFQWRQMVSWHVEMCGNHHSFINRVFGKVKELFPFTPGTVKTVDLGQGEFEYEVTAPDGSKKIFPAESMLHIRGPSWDGINGLEVVKIAREAIGLAMVTEESAASLHKNGIRPSGIYSVEGNLDGAQYKSLSDWIDKHYAGSLKAGKPLILDRAAKWIGTQMTGVDAQALETRKNQIEEICRFHGVMPIMAGYSDKTATYASAEQMFLAHVQHCLAPRWTNYEQSFDGWLLTEKEQDSGLFFNFVEEGMLRGSIEATANVLDKYVNGGLMTPNEGRAKLDMNPDPDPVSDKLRVPANIVGKEPQGAKNDNQNA
jgi:HK97 family phage portal protein